MWPPFDGRIDIRRPASFFSHLKRADRGIKDMASAGLSRKIEAVPEELRRRRIAIDVRGPGGR